MVQNLIFAILFSKLLFRALKVFYIRPHVPVDIIRVIFIPDFLAGSLNPTKTSEKNHSFYNTVLLKKPHSFYEPQLTSH